MARLQDPVTSLKGVGPTRAKQLENLNIYTLGDLICHFPRRCVPCLALIVPPRRGLDCRGVAPRLLAGWVSEETIELPSFFCGAESSREVEL